jgi:hypothetical protein
LHPNRPGDTLTYSYTDNLLSQMQIPGEGSLTWNTYQWNQPTQLTLPGGIRQKHQYDPLMRPRQIESRKQDDSLLIQRDYHYSASGNISYWTRLGLYICSGIGMMG